MKLDKKWMEEKLVDALHGLSLHVAGTALDQSCKQLSELHRMPANRQSVSPENATVLK